MAEILAHPWLEGPTPGIVYVPAPSVHELAQPLPSPSHIDRDLFESLCVIWGRHADFDGIKADLLSPAGQGTLAKAFYFLLLKHRERTMEEHGILMDATDMLNVPGKVITKQYAAPRGRAKFLRPNVSASGPSPNPVAPQQLKPTRTAPDPPTRTPSPTLAVPIRIAIPTERTPSRNHPPSPIGPRPQKPRPQSSPAPPNSSVLSVPPIPRMSEGSRPVSARPGELPTRSLPPTFERSSPFQPPHHSTPKKTSPTPTILHAPTPVKAAPPPILPMITAPRVENADLQKTFDHYASMVNVQAASWNAAVQDGDVDMDPPSGFTIQPTVSTQAQHHAAPEDDGVVDMDIDEDDVQMQDKENFTPKRKRAMTESSGGLGFGASVPMRDQANTIYNKEAHAKDDLKVRRDRKSKRKCRHTALALYSMLMFARSCCARPHVAHVATQAASFLIHRFAYVKLSFTRWHPRFSCRRRV